MYRLDERALFGAPVLLLAASLLAPLAAQEPFAPTRISKWSGCCLFSLNPEGSDVAAYDEAGARIFRSEIAFEGASRVTLLDAASEGASIAVSGVAWAGSLRREFVAFLDPGGKLIHVVQLDQFEPRAICIGSSQSIWVAGQPMERVRGFDRPLLRRFGMDGKLLGEFVREPLGGTPHLLCLGDNAGVSLPGGSEWVESTQTGEAVRRLKLPDNGEISGLAVVRGRVYLGVAARLYRLGGAGEGWAEVPAPPDFRRLLGGSESRLVYLDTGRRMQFCPIPE